jgi:glycosyltransferase involved in cell wall biosynthesis
MRIAIDARELDGKPTGVGRYLSEILSAWKDLPAAAAHEFILCAPGPHEGRGTRWEQLTLPRLVREARADVLFSPGYTGPALSPTPIVVAIHDVSFAAHPEWFGWKEGLRRRTLTRLTARRACRVVTISEFSKREIVEHLGVDPGKIDVVYIAAGRTRPRAPGAGGQEGPRRNLVLFVGSLFNRRHLPELIEGFGRVARRRPDVRLEIVGDNRTNPHINISHLAAEAAVGHRIRIRSYVGEDELSLLYSEARAFAFLSEYEGFGLTPLEALAAGVPIVVLDTPVAREIYGDAATYVPRADPALIDAALDRVLFDEAERLRIFTEATGVLSRYSWRDCATKVLEILTGCGASASIRASARPGAP